MIKIYADFCIAIIICSLMVGILQVFFYKNGYLKWRKDKNIIQKGFQLKLLCSLCFTGFSRVQYSFI